MNIKSVSTLLALMLLAAGCGTTKITTDRARGYDFSQIKTYQWVDASSKILSEDDTYLSDDFVKAFNNEFSGIGLQRVEGDADAQMSYYVKLKEQEEYTEHSPQSESQISGGLVYSRNNKKWSYAEGDPNLNVYTVEIGTLILLVHDVKTGEQIWRGKLTTKIDRSLPENEQAERIRLAVMKLMARFPTILR